MNRILDERRAVTIRASSVLPTGGGNTVKHVIADSFSL